MGLVPTGSVSTPQTRTENTDLGGFTDSPGFAAVVPLGSSLASSEADNRSTVGVRFHCVNISAAHCDHWTRCAHCGRGSPVGNATTPVGWVEQL